MEETDIKKQRAINQPPGTTIIESKKQPKHIPGYEIYPAENKHINRFLVISSG